MAFQGIYQITLFVKDMQKMVAFYRDTVGLSVNYPLQADYTVENWVTLQAGSIILALHAGGSADAISHTPQLCFQVDDVATERERLIAAGVQIEEIIVVSPTTQFALARDPEGNMLSIDQITS